MTMAQGVMPVMPSSPKIVAFSTDNAITIHQRGFLAQDQWIMLTNWSGIDGLSPGRFSVVGAGNTLYVLKDDGSIFCAVLTQGQLPWKQLKYIPQPPPQPPFHPHGPQPPAISFDGFLYICGGGPVQDPPIPPMNTNVCEKYALLDGTPMPIGGLPTPRRANTLVEAGVSKLKSLYCIGGISNTPGQEIVLNSVEKLVEPTWVSVSSMKQPRAGAAAAGHGSLIFVLGGYSVDSKSVEYYDTTTNIWTMLLAQMICSKTCFRAFVVTHPDENQQTKDYLYAVGGDSVERLALTNQQVGVFHTPPSLAPDPRNPIATFQWMPFNIEGMATVLLK